jgi:hypothetical protein
LRKAFDFPRSTGVGVTGLLVTLVLLALVGSARASEPPARIEFRQPPQDDSLAVAYDCLAALALSRTAGNDAIKRAESSAQQLLVLMSTDDQGRQGWPYAQRLTEKASKCHEPGSIDAFGDGTCNPRQTAYMLQTGYATACLAQLSIATRDKKYVAAAKKAISDSWRLGTSVAGCSDCFYYWYSYHPNDQGRYVRNTNLAMGYGIAWLYAATGAPEYRARALAIGRAEQRELQGRNFGYFGIDDPRYRKDPRGESARIENHVVHQLNGLKAIATLAGGPELLRSADEILDSFLNCNNKRCSPANCGSWAAPVSCKATATIAPCILASERPSYAARCDLVERALTRKNAFQVFSAYGPRQAADLTGNR